MYVIYNPIATKDQNERMFWSNETGWADLGGATLFTEKDVMLPLDGEWVDLDEARTMQRYVEYRECDLLTEAADFLAWWINETPEAVENITVNIVQKGKRFRMAIWYDIQPEEEDRKEDPEVEEFNRKMEDLAIEENEWPRSN